MKKVYKGSDGAAAGLRSGEKREKRKEIAKDTFFLSLHPKGVCFSLAAVK